MACCIGYGKGFNYCLFRILLTATTLLGYWQDRYRKLNTKQAIANQLEGFSLMARYSRILIALTILLSGLALIPQAGIFAGVVRWQRFAGGYEDVVTVTRARYRDGELEVRAISSSGGLATLSVYRTNDNFFIGNLQFEGSDHRGDFNISPSPQVITVRSSLGGESTVLVQNGSGVPVTVTPSITPTPGAPTNTPTSTSVPPTVTPGGPTLTPTSTSVPPTVTSSVTPGGPTLTPTASVTPGGPTLTPTASVTPGGPTLTPTATTVAEEPTVTPTATTPSGNSSTLYLPLLFRRDQ
jgi:hypothetical protein